LRDFYKQNSILSIFKILPVQIEEFEQGKVDKKEIQGKLANYLSLFFILFFILI